MLVCSSVGKVTSRSYFYFPVPNAIYVGELILRTELTLSGEKQRPFFIVILSLQDKAQNPASIFLSLPHQKEFCLFCPFPTPCPCLIKWRVSVTMFIRHKGVAVSVLAVFTQNHGVQKGSTSVCIELEGPECKGPHVFCHHGVTHIAAEILRH